LHLVPQREIDDGQELIAAQVAAQVLGDERSLRKSELVAMCGVTMTFSMAQNAWPGGSGSGSVTSSPAPPTRFARSAATSASVTTLSPRPMLMNSAPGLMAAKKRSSNMPRVAGVSGVALTTTSARPASSMYSSARPTYST
jgi:hypothetical protein